MTPALLYFGFHRRSSFREAWRRRDWSFFGHVEAWGVMSDGETWFFLDPAGKGTSLQIEHRCDEVDALFAARLIACETVYRVRPPDAAIRLPLHPTMNCVSQCAHLIGSRAYRPATFRRILRAHGAEVVR